MFNLDNAAKSKIHKNEVQRRGLISSETREELLDDLQQQIATNDTNGAQISEH